MRELDAVQRGEGGVGGEDVFEGGAADGGEGGEVHGEVGGGEGEAGVEAVELWGLRVRCGERGRGGEGGRGLTKAVLVVVEGEVQVLGGGVVVVMAAGEVVFGPGLGQLMMPVLVDWGGELVVMEYGGLIGCAGLDIGDGAFIALLVAAMEQGAGETTLPAGTYEEPLLIGYGGRTGSSVGRFALEL